MSAPKQCEATSDHRIPFGQKTAYGFGMLENIYFAAALVFFMVGYLLFHNDWQKTF